MSRFARPHAEPWPAPGVLEAARSAAEAHRAQAGVVVALVDPLPAVGSVRVLRLGTWHIAQAHGLGGWVTLRRFGSHEAAADYLAQREAETRRGGSL